ncbi:MAG: N-6 DNA methylase [Gammaproteobacteria bacterium]|nr:N-6 DNA methylase [Gammaproteobacteria bacterium]
MSELAAPLRHALEATGYLSNGQPAAPSVGRRDLARSPQHDAVRLPSFEPDVWWRSNAERHRPSADFDLKVYFKFAEEPDAVPVAEWQQEIWNQGFAPLLWVVSPNRIDLYNGFGEPSRTAEDNRLRTFTLLDAELAKLDALAGRLTMETGQFWHLAPTVNRTTTVDQRLLRHLAALERNLVRDDLPRDEAQALIGRSIFAQYLVDRGSVTQEASLADLLRDGERATQLFDSLRDAFNGDMFPPTEATIPDPRYLDAIAEFLEGTDPETGDPSFFPYRFDVIPVELISAIYEQFVHAAEASADHPSKTSAKKAGVYYTPVAAVSLVLDEVFEGLAGDESVLDLTCGSGIFLVESMRRLVHLRSGGAKPAREVIRRVLYEQIHGVDIMPEALRIAAFSLYLAALDLDPDPGSAKFEPLIGRTLRVGDAFDIDFGDKRFDVIVGNPPWSFRGQQGTRARRARSSNKTRQPRGESLDFVRRAMAFAHDRTKFGMILSATPFFSRSGTGIKAVQDIVEALAPVGLVNLSELSRWLFPKANMPAIALLACREEPRPDGMTLVQARWSPTGERSHTIELAPSDIATLPIPSWKRNAGLLKASFLGRRHDLLLLDDLWEKQAPLESRLEALGVHLHTGLTIGNRSRDASFLSDLPLVQQGIRHFDIPCDLPPFSGGAERPRDRAAFAAPLLLVGEYMQDGVPRPVAAVSERDLVFTNSYFGASFDKADSDAAFLVSAILGSALSTWYFLMTGSAFGVWIRRLMRADIVAMPTPDLQVAIAADEGKRVLELARTLHGSSPNESDWSALDNAVFDLYRLDEEDRMVVQDGLHRATWQWDEGRLASVAPAKHADLDSYARAFLDAMDAWLSGAGRRRMRAEIMDMDAPLRVIRFVLEDTPGPPDAPKTVPADGPLGTVLSRIAQRAKVPVTDVLVGVRDLTVYADNEILIIKPAAARNWLGVQALADADAVVRDSVDALTAS